MDAPRSVAVPTGALTGLIAWIAGLPDVPLRRAVPELILQLDRVLDSTMDVETRYQTVRALKGAVIRVAAALPKGGSALSGTGPAGAGLALEQRLYAAMARNCRRLLQEIDRERFGGTPGQPRRRHWAVRNSFRFFARQIISAVECGRPWPSGVWQGLHDLYVYLVVRGSGGDTRPGGGRSFDAEQAYKRLLLVGLVAELVDRQGMSGAVVSRLAAIADDSSLADPHGLLGEYGLTLVEVSCDRPPRLKPERLNDPFRGWVLRTPPELEVLLLNLDPMPKRMEVAARAA